MWQELSVELSEILQEMFDQKYEELKAQKKMPKSSAFKAMNSLGSAAIDYAQQVIKSLMAKEEKYEYVQALLNLQFLVARVYGKIFEKEKEKIIANMKESLNMYMKIREFLKEYATTTPMSKSIEEQFRMANEMCELLPVKIAKIANS